MTEEDLRQANPSTAVDHAALLAEFGMSVEEAADAITRNVGLRRPEPAACPRCGKPEDSFACKIRHVNIARSTLR